MYISPFTPLFFGKRKTDGKECQYVQTFAVGDVIAVQVLQSEEDEVPTFSLLQEGCNIGSITPVIRYIGNGINALVVELHPSEGVFQLQIGDKVSHPFRVISDAEELEDTILLQYFDKTNSKRTDVAFVIDGKPMVFSLRVHGGFKDSNWTFAVDTEQFVLPDGDISQLYAMATTQKKLTIGTSTGVGVEYAELLNWILCCDYVYIDGERYTRKDSATPEMTAVHEGYNAFVINQQLQHINSMEAKMYLERVKALRMVDRDNIRKVSENDTRLI